MTFEQFFVFAVLALTLVLFIWNRWRYDIVAVMALLVVALAGLVPPAEVFAGFGHPAVITVAAVLVLSRGLVNAGIVDIIARLLWRVGGNITVQVAALTGIVALLSAFMNNIAAMALLMPVGITIARRRGSPPSLLLMPMATASLLGGMTTLIGTPPNIIIGTYREQTAMDPFRMFDFMPVGGGVALAGLIFVSLVGWRLMPHRTRGASPDEFFDISDYIAEIRLRDESRYVGQSLHELVSAMEEEAEVIILGLFRDRKRQSMPPMHTILRSDDVLLVEADPGSLRTLMRITDAELVAGAGSEEESPRQDADDLDLREVIVTADSPLAGSTVTALDMRRRYGVNVIAVARQGGQLRERLKRIRFQVGDILLVQGSGSAVTNACRQLGCLPLADRGLRMGRPRRMPLTLGIFVAALAVAAMGIVPAATALVAGAVVMLLTGIISPREAYRSVDLPIIILLAAMIPVGQSLETTGGAQLIADALSQIGGATSVTMMLAIVLVATMFLSDVINNAAAAILIAPIAIDVAATIGVSADPFLMAVAVGASCAFNTPIGHQSNTLVLAAGGYEFGDYWKLGLPMTIVVAATAVPLILWAWPPLPV
ncbi:MAG: SLC13 family permease [Armatimonadota bacterium]